MRLLLLFITVLSVSLRGAVHYVDVAATGANDGSSWANAWTNLMSVDREHGGSTNLVPGDTVCVKGGVYTNMGGYTITNATQYYASEVSDVNTNLYGLTNVITFEFNPWRVQEGASNAWNRYVFTNGLVTLYCEMVLNHYTEINGAANPDYATNIGNNTYLVPMITNNCNLYFNRETNWFNVGSGGNCINVADAPTIVKWVRMHGTTNIYAPIFKNDSSQNMWVYPDPTSEQSEFAYLWFDQSSGHGAAAALSVANYGFSYGVYNIHHCLFETNGSDVCNMTGGVDFHHNVIRNRGPTRYSQGCNDSFTIVGDTSYIRIHHNVMETQDNTSGYTWGSVSNIHDLSFYCNVLRPVEYPYTPLQAGRQGAFLMEQDVVPAGDDYHVRSNLFFVNNTWIGTTNHGPGALMSWVSKNLDNNIYVDTGAVVVKNNLIVDVDLTPHIYSDVSRALGFYSPSNSYGKGWRYQNDAVVLDYNLFGEYTAGNLFAVLWGEVTNTAAITLTNATDISNTLGYTNNVSSTTFRFVDPTTYDYRPAGTDVYVGQDLTSLTNLMPDLDMDIYGVRRPSGAAWSAGAVEYTNTGLLLYLTFAAADWTTNGNYLLITDHSGWTNNAVGFDPTGWSVPIWPSRTNGPGTLTAAQFIVNTNDGSFGYGTYLGVTNFNGGLDHLTNATWLVWAYDESGDPTAYDALLNCGYSITNNWRLGKYYTSNNVVLAHSTEAGETPYQSLAQWPDLTTTATNWHHYAATWDGTNTIAYFDGSAIQTNGIGGTNAYVGFLSSTNSSGTPTANWIGIGVATHNGTYLRTDEDGLPNHGQFLGKLADVRIYNRSLAASEVSAIYVSAGYQPGGQTNAPTTGQGWSYGGKFIGTVKSQ